MAPSRLSIAASIAWFVGGGPLLRAQSPSEIDRHVDIKVEIPSTGTTSGLVIAYGHIIPAPYRFEYKGDKLFLNGVQLRPSPVSDKETTRYKAFINQSTSPDNRKLINELLKIEWQAQAMHDKGSSRDEILQFAQSHPTIVAEAKWAPSGALVFRLADEKDFLHSWIFFDGSQQINAAADVDQLKAEEIKRYENDLENNTCLFFTSNDGLLKTSDPRIKISKIMNNQELSSNDRFTALLEVLPHRIAVRDVLANFSTTEWTPKAK